MVQGTRGVPGAYYVIHMIPWMMILLDSGSRKASEEVGRTIMFGTSSTVAYRSSALSLVLLAGLAAFGGAGAWHTLASATENRSLSDSVVDLALYRRGAVGFEDRPIPADTLRTVLTAITPHSSLAPWRLVAVAEASHRIRLLESMQEAYRQMERDGWATTMERWKRASVLLAFALPKSFEEFGGVPPEVVRPLAALELGMGVQNLVNRDG